MSTLLKLIDDAIITRAVCKEQRSYMGASSLGEPCDRKLWYSYKQPEVIIDPRINRIFDMGNMIEDYLVKLLNDTGHIVYTKDDDNKQFGFVDGIIAGHIDGVISLNVPHLLEFKSYNDSRYKELVKSGVKESAPIYYTQCCVYMEKMNLDKCLFMALNKNTAEIYIEIINSDPIEANWAINRGKEIGNRDTEPDRKYDHKSHFKCKLCSYRKTCWAEA